MTHHIVVADDGPVRTIRINRPEKKNALTQEMYGAMADAITGAGGDAHVRCVLILGAPGAFSAGNDLQDFMQAATPAGEVDAEALKAAREIAALPPEAVAIARRLMKGAPDEIVARMDEEGDHFRDRLKSDEARAAFMAFFNRKR